MSIFQNYEIKWLKFKEIVNSEEEEYLIKHECNNSLKLLNLNLNQLKIVNNNDDFKSSLEFLKLDDKYLYWSKLIDASYIPQNAIKICYDKIIKNFIYIGRILQNGNYIYGTVTNFCEYIPAIAIKLSNIYTLDINDNEQKALNYSTTNYEVLCVKTQPLKLQNLCIKSILSVEIKNSINGSKMLCNQNMPSSLRRFIWPTIINMDDSLKKLTKLCSKNLKYEIAITQNGIMKFNKFNGNNEIQSSFIYEKDIDSLVLCKNGVLLQFDFKQAFRRPIILHEFTCPNKMFYSIYLKLTNTGKLKLIKRGKDLTFKICLINLEDYFIGRNNEVIGEKNKNSQKNCLNNCQVMYMPHAFEIETLDEYDRNKFKLIDMLFESFKIFHIPLFIFKFFILIFKSFFKKIF